MSARLSVTSRPLFPERISPLIYGEFVEFLNDLIPGMWAERVRDRAFAGLTEPRCFYRQPAGSPAPVWRALGVGTTTYGPLPSGDLAFDLDPERPFVGAHSARIRFRGGSGLLAGIGQDGVGVRRSERLDLEVYLRGEGLEGRVRVLLGREHGVYFDTYDEAVFTEVSPEWRRYAGVLHPPVTDPDACLAILLDAPGSLWVDKVSLMPADHRDGWRADVVEAVRQSRPGIIRFGGSSLIYYDWRQGIGPRERRAPFLNVPWNNTEENDVGLDEFLRFCELVEAEPLICVNANSSSPEEIAAQVEYVNGPPESEHGGQRAANGHPRPYQVRYWQIGNEQQGEEYERVLPLYARAMKQVDPTIELMASYPSPAIIGRLGAHLDYVCPHFYTPDVAACQAETASLRRAIASGAANPGLKLAITEWNHTGGDWGDGRAWLQTLYNGLHVARMLNLYQRNGDLIRIANRSNLVNSAYSGAIQTRPLELYLTPAHHVQRLYACLSGTVAVTVATEERELDLSATMDPDGRRFVLWLVNPHPYPIHREIALESKVTPTSVKAVTVTGPGPTAVNSFPRPDHVAPREESLDPAPRIEREFPAWSVTGIELILA